jgi:hypothetical protein
MNPTEALETDWPWGGEQVPAFGIRWLFLVDGHRTIEVQYGKPTRLA